MMSLSVISSEKVVLETQCEAVTVPTTSGIITILPHHTGLYSLISPGDVILKNKSGDRETLIVNGGFISVFDNRVVLLTDFGIRLEDIDESIIAQAKERAEKAMEDRTSEENFAAAQAELFKALLQLKAVQRHQPKR